MVRGCARGGGESQSTCRPETLNVRGFGGSGLRVTVSRRASCEALRGRGVLAPQAGDLHVCVGPALVAPVVLRQDRVAALGPAHAALGGATRRPEQALRLGSVG